VKEHDAEQVIADRGLTAPRITPDHLDSVITGEQYHVFPGTTLTVCCLTLANGYSITGESAAVSPANFDAQTGREVARADAREKIWQLEGYLLKQKLHEAALNNDYGVTSA